MQDKTINDARIYTDVQGLEQLRGKLKNDPNVVKKEVAKQFEAMLVQMMMKSMRQANKTFASGMFSSTYMDYYTDFFDKQISLVIANQGLGFDKVIEKNLGVKDTDNKIIQPQQLAQSHRQTEKTDDRFKTPKDFIHRLWSAAKEAAHVIGTTPGVLLAQAALETDWGKKVIKHDNGSSSFNMFNIKADKSWKKKKASVQALEERNGVLIKEQSHFRSYNSYQESFHDYVNFIKANPRYKEALKNARSPANYLESLQKCGYATDQHYAKKVMQIMSSDAFQTITSDQKQHFI